MAECPELFQNNIINGFDAEGYENFCENFTYSENESCCHCNGFYAPNFGEPLCGNCHEFLFPVVKTKRSRIICISEHLKMNEMDPTVTEIIQRVFKLRRIENIDTISSSSSPVAKRLGIHSTNASAITYDLNFDTAPSSSNALIKGFASKHAPDASICESDVDVQNIKCDTNISKLPAEVFLQIFSCLDDTTLYFNIRNVCKQWRVIVESPQLQWKKHTKTQWPAFQERTIITNWFQIYSSLVSSSFCRTCVIQMMQKSSLHRYDKKFLRHRFASSQCQMPDIISVPFDGQLSHWQATIIGPPGSPYEGGTFYLHIFLPPSYPFVAPVVKFLTKIIHPNISRHGDVGLDILTDKRCHSLAVKLEGLLRSIQSLFCDPYTKVCMEPELGRMYDVDRPRFDALARHWTRKYAMIGIPR